VADPNESPGGPAFLDIVKSMISNEAPPRVMRFFRYSGVTGAADVTWLHQRAAGVFMEG
jgi:hypothetical protein